MTTAQRILAIVLFLPVALPARADEDDDKTGELQPVAPSAQYQVPNFQNLGHGDFSFALTPDGKSVVVSGHGNWMMVHDLVRRKEPRQGKQLMLEEQLQMFNASLAFAPDGTLLVGGGQHGGDMSVHFLDAKTGKGIRQIDNDQPLFGLAATPDGRALAVATQQGVELWNAVNGEELRVFVIPPNSNMFSQIRPVTFSRDGRMLAAAMGDTVHLFETASGKERHKITFKAEAEQPNMRFRNYNVMPVGALALSPNDRLLAIGADRAVRVWDLTTDEELPPLVGHQGMVRAVTFAPDGRRLWSFDNMGLKLTWSVPRIVKSAGLKLPRLTAEEFDELWDELGDADAFNSYRAIRHMAAEPQRSTALLAKHLEPVPSGDEKRLEKLVADLQNANGGIRRKAMTELRGFGEAALGALSQIPQNQRHQQSIMIVMNKLEVRYATPERARALKAVQILERIGTPEAKQSLEKLAKGAAGTRLTVAAKTALDNFPTSDKRTGSAPIKMESLWGDLASEDAAVAFRAQNALSGAPKETIALLRQELRPAVEVDAKRIDELITDLDNNPFDVRRKSTAELEALGDSAGPAMKKALEAGPSAEVRRHLERLVERLAGNQTPSGKTLRSMRAVELLERLDSSDARRLLEALAKGAEPAWLTREAKSSLARLANRPAPTQ
jgi:WD40 repeat protein